MGNNIFEGSKNCFFCVVFQSQSAHLQSVNYAFSISYALKNIIFRTPLLKNFKNNYFNFLRDFKSLAVAGTKLIAYPPPATVLIESTALELVIPETMVYACGLFL